jgi:hypothetical protein
LTGLPHLLTLDSYFFLEDFVRTSFLASLALTLVASVIAIPGQAMPANPASAPLGVIVQADRAQVGADITSGGATIYDGDRLETQDTGTLRARMGGSQIYLRPSSAADVHGLANGFSANLVHGTVVLSSLEGQTFQLLANGAAIRPVGNHPTVAQVTYVSPTALVLTSERGAIEISMGDEVKTIDPGTSYRMETVPDDSGPGPQGGPYHTATNHFVLLALIFGGVATGIIAWRALMSPSGL